MKFRGDSLDKELVFNFFWLFSSFEGALIDEGYFRADLVRAEVDWNKFDEEIDPELEKLKESDHPAFFAARRILVEHPPKRREIKSKSNTLSPQNISKNEFEARWMKQTKNPRVSGSLFALRMVRNVRNNLFHGGKRSGEVERNTQLIQAALEVISTCAGLREGIRARLPYAA